MCSLCGIFGVDTHWTTGGIKFEASADPVLRRRERAEQISIINKFLHPMRLIVSEWQGTHYILSNATGKMIVVEHIADIWKAIEIEFNSVFDPLVLNA